MYFRLRQSNVKIKFVTNTTKESRRCLYERLCKLGFQLKIEEIWSSLWAAKDAVSSQSLKPFLLISPDALEDFQGKLGTSLLLYLFNFCCIPNFFS